MTDFREIISKVVSKVPDSQVMSDLDATVAWAKGTGHANTEKLAITGFCWGGRIVWLYSAHNPTVKAGVAWYGRLVTDTDPLHPKNPIDVVAALKAPVLGLYGGDDQGIPVATVERTRPPKSWSTPTRPTRSTPTIVRATERPRPRTAGSGCSPGSRNTEWREVHRPRAAPDRLAHGKRGQAPGLQTFRRDSRAHGAGSQSPFSSAVRNAKENRSNGHNRNS
jgi:hypothetical protein